MKYYKNISLVLPVYRGGDLFLGALKSIEDSPIVFDNIFISFNGEVSADYAKFSELKCKNILKKKYVALTTARNLSAAQHATYILGNLEKVLEPNSLIMNMAHDDRIITPKCHNSQHDFISSLKPDTVYFPSYNFCVAGDYGNVRRIAESDHAYNISEFFWQTMKDNIQTNMSGMILPFSAYQEAVHAMAKSGSGARAEHLFCTASSIRNVQFTKEVSVLIGERADSDGRTLSNHDHRSASLIYVWSYAKNGHLARAGGYLSYVVELSKKLLAYGLESVRRSVGFSA